jgi:hypothetical protein
MTAPTVEDRASSVLGVLGVSPATKAASGRYLRSAPIAPGVRYWATSQPRLKQDFLGVQFYGEGLAEADRRRAALERAGFCKRTPQTGQATFAKPAPFARDGEVDARAIRAIRRSLDAILNEGPKASNLTRDGRPGGFRRFMLASPLRDADLDLPHRDKAWRDGDL